MGGLLSGASLGQWGRLIRANDTLVALTIDQQGSGKLLSVQKGGVEQFAVNNDGSLVLPGGASFTFEDNDKIIMGTGSDAEIYYNGTNLIVDPDVVGTGVVLIADDRIALQPGFTVTIIAANPAANRAANIPVLAGDDTFVFLGATQVLAAKTLTSPVITTSPTAAGATWADLGAVSTIDINGGTVDGLTSLGIRSTGAAYDLKLATAVVFTAGRTLTLTTGDADRAITLSGNPTLADWFDQAVKAASNPTFANLTITSFAADWTNAGRTVANLGVVTTVDINGGTLDGVTIGGAAAAAATVTTLSMNNLITWSAGAAITATAYQAGRDADATNQYHVNVPAGAGMEWSINDVWKMLMNSAGHVSIGGGNSAITDTVFIVNQSFTAIADQPKMISVGGTMTTPTGATTSYGMVMDVNVVSGGGTQARFTGFENNDGLTGTWTLAEGIRVNAPTGGTVANRRAIGANGEIQLITPAAIGALAANIVKLGITDIAADDARFGIQAEVGDPIYIGNNAVRISGQNVLGAQGAAVADADGSLASATSQLNALLARIRAHGAIAT